MKMRNQRICGAAIVVISGIILAIALSGGTAEERDATAVLLTLPLGLYLCLPTALSWITSTTTTRRHRRLNGIPQTKLLTTERSLSHGTKESY